MVGGSGIGCWGLGSGVGGILGGGGWGAAEAGTECCGCGVLGVGSQVQGCCGVLPPFSDTLPPPQLNNRKFTMSPRVPPILVLEQRDRQWVPKDKNL